MSVSDPTPTRSPDPNSLRGSFAVLRTEPEGLPKAVSDLIGERLAGMHEAQRLAIPYQGTTWAVPNGSQLCLIERAPSGVISVVCSKGERAFDHGVTSTSIREGEQGFAQPRAVTLGLVPDGVRRVRIKTQGLPWTVAPVKDNMFLVELEANYPPDAVVLQRSEG